MGSSVDHSVFDLILQKHVRDEYVDYQAIRDSSAKELSSYLDLLAIVEAGKLSRNEQLAFYINLCNATTIGAIAQRFRAGYSVAEDGFAIFKQPLARTSSGPVSLIDLRDKIIRPTFKDPRIHVALFTGAVSSHPIANRAYHSADIDRVLEENMKFFATDRFRNPIDEVTRELSLGRQFDWNADDFGGKAALPGYLSKCCGRDYRDFTVSFVEFDWTLNEPKW